MKKNDAGSSLNFLWKFAAYTSLSWIAWGFSLLSVLRSVLLREYGTPWLNSWLLNDWRFFWTFICTNPQVASGSVCSPCPAFWQQMHHGVKAQKPAFYHVLGGLVWLVLTSDTPMSMCWVGCSVCVQFVWMTTCFFRERSLETACSWWCDSSLLSWSIRQSNSFHNWREAKKVVHTTHHIHFTKPIPPALHHKFPPTLICHHPQSPIVIPYPPISTHSHPQPPTIIPHKNTC